MVLFLNSDLHQNYDYKMLCINVYNPIVLHFILYFRFFYFTLLYFTFPFFSLSFARARVLLLSIYVVFLSLVFVELSEKHHIINGTRHLQIDIQHVSKRFPIIFEWYTRPTVHQPTNESSTIATVTTTAYMSVFRPFNPFVDLCFGKRQQNGCNSRN